MRTVSINHRPAIAPFRPDHESSGESFRLTPAAAAGAASAASSMHASWQSYQTGRAADVVASAGLSSAAFSIRGRSHATNQDAFLIEPEVGLFLLADGMTGPRHGECASSLAVLTAYAFLESRLRAEEFAASADPTLPKRWLAEAVSAAHEVLVTLRASSRSLQSIGCTLDLLLLRGNLAFLAHVGDGRVYLRREGVLTRLTSDHTLAQMLRGRGVPSQQTIDARYEHVLSMALGLPLRLEPSISCFDVRPGDQLLLCSDGLYRELDEESIRLQLQGSASAAAWSLVKSVLDKEGDDDTTVIVVEIEY